MGKLTSGAPAGSQHVGLVQVPVRVVTGGDNFRIKPWISVGATVAKSCISMERARCARRGPPNRRSDLRGEPQDAPATVV